MATRNETVGYQRVMRHATTYTSDYRRFLILELVRGPYGEEWWLRVREQLEEKADCCSHIVSTTPMVYREGHEKDQQAKLKGEPSERMKSAMYSLFLEYDKAKFRNKSRGLRHKWFMTDEMDALVVLARDNAAHNIAQRMTPEGATAFAETHGR